MPEVPGLAAVQPAARIEALGLGHLPDISTLKIHPAAPHGLCSTLKDRVNDDLLAFFQT